MYPLQFSWEIESECVGGVSSTFEKVTKIYIPISKPPKTYKFILQHQSKVLKRERTYNSLWYFICCYSKKKNTSHLPSVVSCGYCSTTAFLWIASYVGKRIREHNVVCMFFIWSRLKSWSIERQGFYDFCWVYDLKKKQ